MAIVNIFIQESHLKICLRVSGKSRGENEFMRELP
jgi:hypothetical protein